MATQDINSVTSGESALDKLWNFATGTFDRGLTYVMEQENTKRLTKLREAEANAALAQKENYSAATSVIDTMNTMSGANMVPYLAAAVLGLGAFILYARK